MSSGVLNRLTLTEVANVHGDVINLWLQGSSYFPQLSRPLKQMVLEATNPKSVRSRNAFRTSREPWQSRER